MRMVDNNKCFFNNSVSSKPVLLQKGVTVKVIVCVMRQDCLCGDNSGYLNDICDLGSQEKMKINKKSLVCAILGSQASSVTRASV